MERRLYIADLTVDPKCKAPRWLPLEDNLGLIALIEGDTAHLIASAKRGVALVCLETGKLQYLCRYVERHLEQK